MVPINQQVYSSSIHTFVALLATRAARTSGSIAHAADRVSWTVGRNNGFARDVAREQTTTCCAPPVAWLSDASAAAAATVADATMQQVLDTRARLSPVRSAHFLSLSLSLWLAVWRRLRTIAHLFVCTGVTQRPIRMLPLTEYRS